MDDLCNLQRLLRVRGVPADVSRATRIPETTVSAWKRGVSVPAPGNLFALSTFFGYSQDVLLSCDESLLRPPAPPGIEKTPAEAGGAGGLTKQQLYVQELMSCLPEEVQEEIARFAEYTVSKNNS